ncbi:MAG: hypothetical protein LBM87_08425 [Ruminococcus sp.]|jgi:hypothetical protein|nr:hypothetical protein [Ruminococcus sp.]
MSVDFDKIVTKTVNGAKVVAGKAVDAATEFADFSRAQIERAALRDKIKDLYRELGRLYYSRCSGETVDGAAMTHVIEEIDKLYANMKETDGVVTKTKGKICGFCNAKNEPSNLFCVKCGEKL